MLEEYEIEKQRQLSQSRTIANYIRGGFFLCLGIFFLIYEQLGINLGKKPSGLDKIMGIIFVLYGAWRIYRGYKKNYFKNDRT